MAFRVGAVWLVALAGSCYDAGESGTTVRHGAHFGPGTIVSRGAEPGAVVVELQGPPSEPVELWTLDDSDVAVAKVAFGSSDADGRTVLTLGAAISEGDRFAVKHPESEFF